MIKRSITVMLTLVLAVAMIFTFPFSEALACANYFDYSCRYMINGVGSWGNHNRYYWVSSSASAYSSMIDAAVSSWVYTTSCLGYSTSISLVRSYDQDTSMFEVHMGATVTNTGGVLAETRFMISGGNDITSPTGPTQNWVWARITLNSNNFPNISDQNDMTESENKQGTIAHEFGHAMGLDHSVVNGGVVHIWIKDRLMCQLGEGRTEFKPTVKDLEVINHLYG